MTRAETMAGPDGRQYHIGLAPGEVAPRVLLCGDPARAERFAATYFDAVELDRRHREFVTLTGTCRGQRVSVIATGMGADNTEIALVELAAVVEQPVLVRMGSCGALQPEIGLGDLVVSTGAVRLEATTAAYVPDGFPAVADPDLVLALRTACQRARIPCWEGLTATAPGFYGAQGRSVGPFRARRPEVLDELAACRVLNLEMEASALFTLATLAGWRAGAVCAVYASRTRDEGLDDAGRLAAEARCMAVALDAVLSVEPQ